VPLERLERARGLAGRLLRLREAQQQPAVGVLLVARGGELELARGLERLARAQQREAVAVAPLERVRLARDGAREALGRSSGAALREQQAAELALVVRCLDRAELARRVAEAAPVHGSPAEPGQHRADQDRGQEEAQEGDAEDGVEARDLAQDPEQGEGQEEETDDREHAQIVPR
jgi:hypothetical protein